jgi:hypothetical protein
MTSLSIHMGTAPPDLQAAINAASSGATINATGGTYSGSFTINKALTLIGGTITVPTGTASGLYITHNDVVVDGTEIIGSDFLHFATASPSQAENFGIYALGTSGAPLTGLVIRNCTIHGFQKSGMWIKYVAAPVISYNDVHDCVYTGITLLSATGGTISWNAVSRIGYSCANTELPENTDAYGIVCEDQGAPRCSDVVVSDNVVEDVPWWHGLDTHGGLRISFLRNTVRRCCRALFLTGSTVVPYYGTALVVTGNVLLEPTNPNPALVNPVPVTLASIVGATFTDNQITGWGGASPPDNQHPWYDYASGSTGLVDGGGNVVTP